MHYELSIFLTWAERTVSPSSSLHSIRVVSVDASMHYDLSIFLLGRKALSFQSDLRFVLGGWLLFVAFTGIALVVEPQRTLTGHYKLETGLGQRDWDWDWRLNCSGSTAWRSMIPSTTHLECLYIHPGSSEIFFLWKEIGSDSRAGHTTTRLDGLGIWLGGLVAPGQLAINLVLMVGSESMKRMNRRVFCPASNVTSDCFVLDSLIITVSFLVMASY